MNNKGLVHFNQTGSGSDCPSQRIIIDALLNHLCHKIVFKQIALGAQGKQNATFMVMFGARCDEDTAGLVCRDHLDTQTPVWPNKPSFPNCKLQQTPQRSHITFTHQTVACIVKRLGKKKTSSSNKTTFQFT